VVGQFPRVNGTIVSGDWPAVTRASFGTEAVNAPAPTVAEEPNTTQSPFDNPPPLGVAPPQASPQTAAAKPVETGTIDLPGGRGVIRIVPGGIKNPAGLAVPAAPVSRPIQTRKIGKGEYQVAQAPPEPKFSSNGQYAPLPAGVSVNSGAFVLGAPQPPAFVMGVYRLDFNGDGRLAPGQNVWNSAGGTALADQPMNGAGPWFSGLRPQWHREQLTDMRLAGIEVALIRTQPGDALLPRELDAFVEALKEMKAQGLEYPLVGVDATVGKPDLDLIYAHVPPEFRAMQDVAGLGIPGVLVYDLTLGSSDAAKTLADGTPIARVYHSDTVATVSPGRTDRNGVISRKGGRTYDTSWQVALVSTPNQIVVESWNDFAHGTEIAASRQYGEQYVDATRAQVIGYDGDRQWHAKYLSNAVPRTIFPKTLYQIPVRIENAGTLPWRAGEGYSLSTRWYRNGKLYDDSAPRIPIGKDVLPGRSVTLSLGLVARDNFGEDLEPGEYTLVVDMVQGQDRWFSYAGDTPLQVGVTVIGADAGVGGTQATFLGTATPGVAAGQSLASTVQVRNDGSAAWPATYALGYKIQTTDPDGANPKTVAEGHAPLGTDAIAPGQIAIAAVPISLTGKDGQTLPPGAYRIHWFVQPDALGTLVNGSYDEPLRVGAALPQTAFVLADVPHTVDAGRTATARLVVQNVSAQTLKKSAVHLGYHWYYLDGTEREWDGGPTASLTQDLAPGATDAAVTASFQAPKQPGRYALVWDTRVGDGPWQSTLPLASGDMPQQFVNVAPAKGSLVPVDLTKSDNTLGIAPESPGKTGGFDGRGGVLPSEALPPDVTSEIEGDPLLMGKPGLPLYPSGYYTVQTGTDADSNHALSFLYPAVKGSLPNVVSCTGQTIALPSGKYQAVHLLAAASGGAPVTVNIDALYGSETASLPITVADWSAAPPAPAFTASYRTTPAGPKPGPATLGDYRLALDPTKKLTALVLPNERSLKIVAITLEK
jgi:hypothetical protein